MTTKCDQCGAVDPDDIHTCGAKAGPAQEPLFWYRPRSDGMYEGPIHNAQIEQVRKQSGAWVPLAPVTAQPTVPLTNGVLVPLAILEAAERSIGSFCSDHGWTDKDMQNMDNLSACIARHKAGGITKGQP